MRSLTLRKDTLTQLTAEELSAVAAGTGLGLSDACVTQTCTGIMCLHTDVVCLEA